MHKSWISPIILFKKIIQIKLFLGAVGGELTAELPFVLMHPKPNMRKIIKADTLAEVEGFQVRKKRRKRLF